MKINIRMVTTIIIGILLLSPSLLSCRGSDTNLTNVWFVDPNNYFHTNDIERAQQEIPFSIILPKYLPEILGSNYAFQIDGPIKNRYLKEVEIEISYVERDSSIFITEQNLSLVMEPNDKLEPIHYDIAGVKVLRQKSYLYGDPVKIEGLVFDWNQNGFTFAVRIFSISEEEGIKIVESMIKQLE